MEEGEGCIRGQREGATDGAAHASVSAAHAWRWRRSRGRIMRLLLRRPPRDCFFGPLARQFNRVRTECKPLYLALHDTQTLKT